LAAVFTAARRPCAQAVHQDLPAVRVHAADTGNVALQLKGRKIVLSARGRFAPRPVPADYDGTLDRYRASGVREILGLCFAGVPEVIEIDAGATASTAAP
jgi:hypothetical protein